ncbi:Glycerol-3-phosphate cytidylyltransferase (EC [uncultured Gammaproteobacteria bacterium]|nr:Glycerol-3-phosphate cytidylyltransferase (EC [uncultured Gammaproteobacteria bacterium]
MVVYTVGTFDLLHVGHLALLEYCATLGETVVVGIASDEVVNYTNPIFRLFRLNNASKCLKHLAVWILYYPIMNWITFLFASKLERIFLYWTRLG